MEHETTVHRTVRLETRHLILRPLLPSDVTAIFHLYADWEVAKNLSRLVFPFSYQAAQQFIATAQRDLTQASGYMLGMLQRESDAFIGVISLRIPSNDPQLSVEARAAVAGLGILGYAVARPPHWRQGYASESATRRWPLPLPNWGSCASKRHRCVGIALPSAFLSGSIFR